MFRISSGATQSSDCLDNTNAEGNRFFLYSCMAVCFRLYSTSTFRTRRLADDTASLNPSHVQRTMCVFHLNNQSQVPSLCPCK